MRIAIVGSGIAGLSCAHLLGSDHDVTLFEADARLGGHSNTITVEDPEAGPVHVDTGFIVHNDRNYPLLSRLFAELSIPVQDTEMSFAVTDRAWSGGDGSHQASLFTYRATNPVTLFADPRNLVRRDMWQMLADVRRFYRSANQLLAAHEAEPGSVDELASLGEFLVDGRYSRAFIDLHLVPMGASVWSADPATFDAFPALSLFRFLANHGLLGVRDRPQWRTVVGGSRTYVQRIADRFPGTIRLATPVCGIARVRSEAVTVRTTTTIEEFDRVILACHSDQALRILEDPTPQEREILGAIRYQPNVATLHTDTSVLSPFRRAWAAWNYECPRPGVDPQDLATLTYDLTALQRLGGSRRYLVSLNSEHRVDPSKVLAAVDYSHPVFDAPAIGAQQRFDEIDGARATHFCGAYWGYGFHEDGIASAVRVCERLGVEW